MGGDLRDRLSEFPREGRALLECLPGALLVSSFCVAQTRLVDITASVTAAAAVFPCLPTLSSSPWNMDAFNEQGHLPSLTFLGVSAGKTGRSMLSAWGSPLGVRKFKCDFSVFTE